MSEPDILWDVYNSPRLEAVQFGRYYGADHGAGETVLRGAKYAARTFRATGKDARDVIRKYVAAPVPKLGTLDAATEKFNARLTDPARTDDQHTNDLTNLENMQKFVAFWDQSKLGGKLVIELPSEQHPMNVGGLDVRLQVDFLVKGQNKDGDATVGGVFVNTQKGEGLGTRPETKARLDRGGEAVALLVLKRVIDEHSDDASPLPDDCWHFYVRQKKVWAAPERYTRKLGNIAACGRKIVREWPGIEPPKSFDPERAEFHD